MATGFGFLPVRSGEHYYIYCNIESLPLSMDQRNTIPVIKEL